MLGELYKPQGLARETAQAVLKCEEPFACNVSTGCSNQCVYCYLPKFLHTSREQCAKVRHPVSTPVQLVTAQIEKGLHPEGVFLSFLTDPFLPENEDASDRLCGFLLQHNIKVATLSKCGFSKYGVRHGITLVSLDDMFHDTFECYTTYPDYRLAHLWMWKKHGAYVWVSMEPYPTSSIYKQSFDALLERLFFVDLIVFGRWNYDARANTLEARQEYSDRINTLTDFCKAHGIKWHIKSDTLKFVGGN